MRTRFKTIVKEVWLHGLDKCFGVDGVDVDVTFNKITVDWESEISIKPYGINGIETNVLGINIEISWKIDPEYCTQMELGKIKTFANLDFEGNEIRGEIKALIEANNAGNWTICSKIGADTAGICIPKEISVDFYNKLIDIQ